MARRWGALPEAGGLLDQPAGLLMKMARALDVYTVTKGYWQAGDTTRFAELNPDAFELYAWARKMEREHGN